MSSLWQRDVQSVGTFAMLFHLIIYYHQGHGRMGITPVFCLQTAERFIGNFILSRKQCSIYIPRSKELLGLTVMPPLGIAGLSRERENHWQCSSLSLILLRKEACKYFVWIHICICQMCRKRGRGTILEYFFPSSHDH